MTLSTARLLFGYGFEEPLLLANFSILRMTHESKATPTDVWASEDLFGISYNYFTGTWVAMIFARFSIQPSGVGYLKSSSQPVV